MFFRATLLFALSDCKGTKNILDIQMFPAKKTQIILKLLKNEERENQGGAKGEPGERSRE